MAPPLRDFRTPSAGPPLPLPLGPGPKLSEIVDDDRDEEGDNKELYSDLKYHSNGFHWRRDLRVF